ncbi:hypothetical protein D3C85_1410540 [compost metagenome]
MFSKNTFMAAVTSFTVSKVLDSWARCSRPVVGINAGLAAAGLVAAFAAPGLGPGLARVCGLSAAVPDGALAVVLPAMSAMSAP